MKNNFCHDIITLKFKIAMKDEKNMRLDKFLKVSRVIKRRTIANDVADSGRVQVNGRVVKPSYEVKVGDIVEIKFGDRVSKFEILQVPTTGKIVGEVVRIL